MKAPIAILVLLLSYSVPAPAQGVDMLPYYDNAPPTVYIHRVSAPTHRARPKKRRHVARKAAPKDDGTRVLAAEYKTDEAPRCLAPVRVVGSQDIRPDAAEASAQKAWAEHVRWTHGEAFQDFGNATDYQKRCSRSSIGEALGQYFTRCEITAKPCRPGMTQGAP
jgi:hypothetical protein